MDWLGFALMSAKLIGYQVVDFRSQLCKDACVGGHAKHDAPKPRGLLSDEI